MATADSEGDLDEKNLEIFSLIWLDAIDDAKEIHKTERKLRSIINHLTRFQDLKQCQEYIEQTSHKDRLILIVSGRLGFEIVPLIHKHRQVISIYVYCMDRERNEEWSCKFTKVKGVVITLDELISRLAADYQIQKQLEEPLAINSFKTNVGSNKFTPGVNSQFIFFQILIDYLLQLKSTQTDRDELFSRWKNEYQGNRHGLAHLREFEENYSSEKAVWWLTRDSFFSKTLNAALSMKNIHLIFLFRSYILDIYRQLRKCQSKIRLKLYRSQMISKEELKNFQEYLGQFLSFNSFFSTTTDRQRALSFLQTPGTSSDLKQILFEIDADPTMITSKPFAAISEQSEFADKSDVLFMIGSIFRLESITCDDDDNRIWNIHMTLCNDEEHALKQVLLLMKQQFGGRDVTLETLGKVLCKMGKFDLAEKYFNRLLNELPFDHPLRPSLYQNLSEIASTKEDYDMMVQWHQKSLEEKDKYQIRTNSNTYDTSNHSLGATNELFFAAQFNMNAKWIQNAVTIAGGNGQGNQLNQLFSPCGISIDEDDQRIYISEWENHRIVEWKYDAKSGTIVAGRNGKGNKTGQLDKPTDILVDKINDSLIISDHGNRRLMRYSRQNLMHEQIIISDVHCFGLAMDNNGDLYMSDWKKNEVRRWKIGETKGTIVAGGNGQGDRLDQLNCPTYIFVDDHYSVNISDCDNNRVIKWTKGAKEGIIVAGGQGQGNSLSQLSDPQGLTIDHFGHIYVADSSNHRIMRWSSDSKQGTIVIGGNGEGQQSNQFNGLRGLSFDQQGNLYAVDCNNNRIQRFSIHSN